ncbi:hypothetical protein GCM10010517_60990 [Streptosporangium fragile]|uniref:Uncharacterized protein n=1 Tax=Streptosporangium fragile TaxID=46186 RepID=A0ABN3W6D1_9ACTN
MCAHRATTTATTVHTPATAGILPGCRPSGGPVATAIAPPPAAASGTHTLALLTSETRTPRPANAPRYTGHPANRIPRKAAAAPTASENDSNGATRRAARADPDSTSSAAPRAVIGRASGWTTRASAETATVNADSITTAATSNPGRTRMSSRTDPPLRRPAPSPTLGTA